MAEPQLYPASPDQYYPAVDDLRVREMKELAPPAHLIREFPCGPSAWQLICETRRAIHRVLSGTDDRLVVIAGPCSIHDVRAAVDYARRLGQLRRELKEDLIVVMRVYFEKPRTTTGWKGFINDPDLNGSFQINKGLRLARGLLLELNELGVPCATEFLDVITPQYYADLISWGAIGARTTESQIHRELASGLSCPVGFKNGTEGNVKIAVDAIRAARSAHHFLSVTKGGHSAIVSTNGNEDCHLILRGGTRPNYDTASVGAAARQLAEANLAQRLMIDVSHANCQKDYRRQITVMSDVAQQMALGDERIFGLMLESHLVEGRQDLAEAHKLLYGQSITDGCMGWENTVAALRALAQAVRKRRQVYFRCGEVPLFCG